MPANADHEAVDEHLGRDVPPEKCGFGHTAMVQFGRDFCIARNPVCLDVLEAIPIADLWDQVGVRPNTGGITDPVETAV